ncbi:hypothetical protein ACJX0J_027507, partial [Zea mays]
DAGLHINAHFIGGHNPALNRDFTWIQALGIHFAHHILYVGAARAAADDHLVLAFDDDAVLFPCAVGARWSPHAAPALSAITAEDSCVHSYGVDPGDCLAHLDLGFKFYDLTDDVHGVLGQTYRADYVNRLNVTANLPLMGGADTFRSSGLFEADCAVARFRRNTAGTGIAM